MSSNDGRSVAGLGLPTMFAPSGSRQDVPLLFGMPLKYISLVILALQNATLSIVMHYSRVSTSPSEAYSAASAVLLNEIFKGLISFSLALYNGRGTIEDRLRVSLKEVFSTDCWKLSIPAILYVIQNNLQYTAISNLDAATFQVAYQMKILTTAFFSVVLLHKSLSRSRWTSLFLLALGVGIVQVQAGNAQGGMPHSSSDHTMYPMTGFAAVLAACFTSGLAGVYFEMVLKNSKTDLWIRNVQLSLFSLIPALVPVLFSPGRQSGVNPFAPSQLLRNFGPAAWATVSIQVFGGLVTAIVIKYSDNILKGFATSLAIVISFVASIILFHFPVTYTFLLGTTVVLWATWMYNLPEGEKKRSLSIAFTPASPEPSAVAEEGKRRTVGPSGETLIDEKFYPLLDTPPYYFRPEFTSRVGPPLGTPNSGI